MGKSLIFQVAGLLLQGITIVISPLISLMEDQVQSLKKRGISAVSINSLTPSFLKNEIMNHLEEYKFIYLSPEKVENESLILAFQKLKISQLVIDEAHCISMWARDFRKSYQRLYTLKEKLKIDVISCFSATADDKVIKDMVLYLNLKSYRLFKTSFDRLNLYYEVIHTKNRDLVLKDLLNKLSGQGIIYTLTRKNTIYLYQLLNKDFEVCYYHGGLDGNIKEVNMNLFLSGKKRIMIATSSFGMGVDGVFRFVILYDLPMSIEDLSQMLGRAGRDNLKGYGYILNDPSTYKNNEFFIDSILYQDFSFSEMKNIKKIKENQFKFVKKFVNTKKCLHHELVSHFNELNYTRCNMCKNCMKEGIRLDVLTEAKIVIKAIDYYNKINSNKLYNILKGLKEDRIFHSKYYNKIKRSFPLEDTIKKLLDEKIIESLMDNEENLVVIDKKKLDGLDHLYITINKNGWSSL